MDITSYEPSEYEGNKMQGIHESTDLAKPKFSFSFKEVIRMKDNGSDLIGLSTFFKVC